MIDTKRVRAVCEAVIPSRVLCNCCGASCRPSEDAYSFEYATISADWGYGSKGRDMQSHQAHLCQSCYEKMIESWVITPRILDLNSPRDRGESHIDLVTDSVDEAEQLKYAHYKKVEEIKDEEVSKESRTVRARVQLLRDWCDDAIQRLT